MLTFVLYAFVLMYSRRKKPNGVKSAERAAPKIEPPLPIHLPLHFSFKHCTNFRARTGPRAILLRNHLFNKSFSLHNWIKVIF